MYLASRASSLKDLLKSALPPAIAILVVGNFGYHATFGATGVFRLGEYKASAARLETERDKVGRQLRWLERRVELLEPKAVDPDLADELVRRELGLVRPDEQILLYDRFKVDGRRLPRAVRFAQTPKAPRSPVVRPPAPQPRADARQPAAAPVESAPKRDMLDDLLDGL